MRRLSLTGLVLCLLYAAVIAQCLLWANDPQVNDKSQLVWRQLPVILPLMVANGLGLAGLLERLPQSVSYVLLATPMFAGLYVLGSLVEAEIRGIFAARKAASAKRRDGRGP
ncbi:hypothetical protein [Xanthomonas bundabergensis]|uniref:hypothetical protein n=1 Tax=Xanthomonas bundabergensis TaxID=3160842 RepID=UPI003511FB84